MWFLRSLIYLNCLFSCKVDRVSEHICSETRLASNRYPVFMDVLGRITPKNGGGFEYDY
jgi:hypothetical protein